MLATAYTRILGTKRALAVTLAALKRGLVLLRPNPRSPALSGRPEGAASQAQTDITATRPNHSTYQAVRRKPPIAMVFW